MYSNNSTPKSVAFNKAIAVVLRIEYYIRRILSFTTKGDSRMKTPKAPNRLLMTADSAKQLLRLIESDIDDAIRFASTPISQGRLPQLAKTVVALSLLHARMVG